MPRLDGDMEKFAGRGGFAFTGTRIARLEATNYTLVTISVDFTGSVTRFKQQLLDTLATAINACKKDPRSDNIMVRVTYFSTQFSKGVLEVIGFTPLADVDLSQFPDIDPHGGTPLCDSVFESVASRNEYAGTLKKNEFESNAIEFHITDGDDNASVMTPAGVKRELELAVSTEQLESSITILIGINAQQYEPTLRRFQQEAGLTQYTDAGDATPENLAKLGGFISRSISSQSQALGTGGPSQNIAADI